MNDIYLFHFGKDYYLIFLVYPHLFFHIWNLFIFFWNYDLFLNYIFGNRNFLYNIYFR